MSQNDTESTERTERDITRVAEALGDATRRRAFFAVRDAPASQTKADVARSVGIDTRLAGFHLDKLVGTGFLNAEFHRKEGRTGPGAGRPAKHYTLADAEVSVQLPDRHYDLLASLLLRAMREPSGDSDVEALERVGYEFGYEVGLAEVASGGDGPDPEGPRAGVARLLSRLGFAAQLEGDSEICACSCPFEDVAFEDPARICTLDRAIWRGMLAAFAPDARIVSQTARARGDAACTATVDC